MKVARWGDSLAVRLPEALVDKLDLQDGDEVEITVVRSCQNEPARKRRRDEALARIKAMQVPLPPGYKFDRGEIYDRARGGFAPDPDYIDEG